MKEGAKKGLKNRFSSFFYYDDYHTQYLIFALPYSRIASPLRGSQ
jgi:hypothetical protein